MTIKAEKAAAKAEAIDRLRELLPPGSTVHAVLRHVSRSGMFRAIDLYLLQDGDRVWLSRLATNAGVGSWSDRYEAIGVGGCGMDMGFALVYDLSHTLYPQGFDCTGEGDDRWHGRCPSNDHSNGDRDYTPHHHNSGGYAVSHAWL